MLTGWCIVLLCSCFVQLQDSGAEDDAGGSMLGSPQQPSSPVDPVQGVALHDHFGRDSGLSGSDTAFSSGYEVSSDHDRLMYIPRSLKYLQVCERAELCLYAVY